MDRKTKILSYMRSKEYIPLKFEELKAVLDVPREDASRLSDILAALIDEGKIYITKKGRYRSVGAGAQTASGILRCNANGRFGFVIGEEEAQHDVFVSGDKLGDAIDGDRVLVKIDSAGRNASKPEGHILKILKRNTDHLVGVIVKEKDGIYRMEPDNRHIYSKIRIAEKDINNAKIGSRVNVKITEYAPDGKIYGIVSEVLGDKSSVKGCVDGIVIENGIKYEFDEEVLEEAEAIPEKISESDIEGRLDLRNELIITIDGVNARDFDDAVSVKILSNGCCYLGVHIADVSHYVREGSALDREAYERGNSVYLADRVIPMLPERLSNGICSLNPKVDRLTLSVFMEIDSEGNIKSHDIKESVICSSERMTYDDVNDIYDGDEELCRKYSRLVPTLKIMRDLAKVLKERREKRGAINFDFPETEITVDKDGMPVDISYAERGVSNKVIEEFMLAANETIAEYAYWSELPFVYRVHEAPSGDKLAAFNEFIGHFGLMIKGRVDDKDNPVHPKALQKILDAVKERPEEQMIASAMLRSLMKAEYSDVCRGHFGLAAKYYCHYTSPIRRYSDLAVHRILKNSIRSDTKRLSEYTAFVGMTAKHTSETELKAINCEREVDDLMKAVYMSDSTGRSFDGIISSVTSFGMFVTLPNSVEGLIRLENMTDDYYEYNEMSRSLTGRRRNKVYQVGMSVRVTLMRCNIPLRQIDFVLANAADKRRFDKIEKKRSIGFKHKRKYTGNKRVKRNKRK